MREVRITMEDNVHKAVKKFAQDNDMNQNEAIEHLLKAGLRSEKKGKVD